MILGAIYSVLMRIIRLFARLIAWIIVALSLWVPLLYVITFLIICASVRKSPMEYAALFWAGLALTFVIAFFISGYIYEYKRNAKRPKPVVVPGEKVSLKSEKVSLKKRKASEGEVVQMHQTQQAQAAQQPQTAQQTQHGCYAQSNYQPQQSQQTQQAQAAQQGYSQNAYQAQQAYQSYNQPEQQHPFAQNSQMNFQQQNQNNQYGQSVNQSYDFKPKREQFDSLDGQEDCGADDMNALRQRVEPQFMSRRDSFGENAYEKTSELRQEPRIFATRKDPTVFIYEYPDKLEFYKRTREGMVLMETRQREL